MFRKTERFLLLFLVLACPYAALGDVQPVIDQINMLSAREREAVLLKEAKKSADVHWDTTMPVHYTRELVRLLGRRHPFLDTEIRRDTDMRRLGEKLVTQVIAEYRAGKFSPDVINAPSRFVTFLNEAGVITKNGAPFREALRQGVSDREGFINPVYTNIYTFFYNTQLVKAEELPKSYEDLLHPRWKGRLAIDLEDAEWLAGLIEVMGQEKAIEFAKKLAEQKPNLRRGPMPLEQLIAGGQSALAPGQSLHSGTVLKKAGAPVEMHFVEPVLTQTSTAAWVANKTPSPHAGLLLVDFLLSKEAQMIFSRFGRLPARKDVRIQYGLDDKKIHFLSNQWVGDRFKELTDTFSEIFSVRGAEVK